MSLIAFIMYRNDKVKAKMNKWRTKESSLLLVGLFGGAVGALAAMKRFRHKTKHGYFWAVNIAGAVLHTILLFYIIVYVVLLHRI